jgi:hypothetical protein
VRESEESGAGADSEAGRRAGDLDSTGESGGGEEIMAEYRGRIGEIALAAVMPHTLPPAAEARAANAGVQAGPRKPVLEAAFKPMGYSCKGATGVFHLTRRTPGNLTVELYIDVGTWSHSVTANLTVHGAGFQVSVPLPVAAGVFGQYPIGDADQWQKIVQNLAAIVRGLEGNFVAAVEQAADLRLRGTTDKPITCVMLRLAEADFPAHASSKREKCPGRSHPYRWV